MKFGYRMAREDMSFLEAVHGKQIRSEKKKKGGSCGNFLPFIHGTESISVLLAERVVGRRSSRARVHADHAGLVGEEVALTSDARGQWAGSDRVLLIRRGGSESEHIAALGSGHESGVNQVRSRGSRRRRGAQIAELRGIISVGRGKRHGRSVQCAKRTNRGRFVGGHLRTQQVRDGDRRDDQNNRDYDQQLDQRKTFLLLPHYIYPPTMKFNLNVCHLFLARYLGEQFPAQTHPGQQKGSAYLQ